MGIGGIRPLAATVEEGGGGRTRVRRRAETTEPPAGKDGGSAPFRTARHRFGTARFRRRVVSGARLKRPQQSAL